MIKNRPSCPTVGNNNGGDITTTTATTTRTLDNSTSNSSSTNKPRGKSPQQGNNTDPIGRSGNSGVRTSISDKPTTTRISRGGTNRSRVFTPSTTKRSVSAASAGGVTGTKDQLRDRRRSAPPDQTKTGANSSTTATSTASHRDRHQNCHVNTPPLSPPLK